MCDEHNAHPTKNDLPQLKPPTLDAPAWDDDDFDVPTLSSAPAEQPRPTPAKVGEDDDDDWCTPAADKVERRPSSKAWSTDVFTGSSTQARALNTPASQKKRRCSECTRPLADDDERLCARCAK